MKKRLLIAVLIVVLSLLVGCESQANIESTITKEPIITEEPTATKEPTATPTEITYDDEKKEIANAIKSLTNVDGTNIFCDTVKWEGDLLEVKCDLVDWFIEPSEDHHFLHYWVLDEAIRLSLNNDEWQRYFSDETIIKIVTVGNTMEQLSKTSYFTFEKLMDGSISTEVEWLSEADVIIN